MVGEVVAVTEVMVESVNGELVESVGEIVSVVEVIVLFVVVSVTEGGELVESVGVTLNVVVESVGLVVEVALVIELVKVGANGVEAESAVSIIIVSHWPRTVVSWPLSIHVQ